MGVIPKDKSRFLQVGDFTSLQLVAVWFLVLPDYVASICGLAVLSSGGVEADARMAGFWRRLRTCADYEQRRTGGG